MAKSARWDESYDCKACKDTGEFWDLRWSEPEVVYCSCEAGLELQLMQSFEE